MHMEANKILLAYKCGEGKGILAILQCSRVTEQKN